MNTAFKVVFNRARRALMVVNEVTSSVQAKGTKTVVVAAVASLLAGGAVAAEGPFTVENEQKYAEDITADKVAENDLTVIAKYEKADASGYVVNNEGVTFTNKGTITITGLEGAKSWKQEGILTDLRATAVNEGKIIATNAYGMKVGTLEASTIINNGEITVSVEGVGMELGGADNSKAINNGTITVKEKTGDFAVGVLVKGTSNVTFENNGTISATAEGMKAISVEKDDQKTADVSMTFGEESKVEGLISLDEGTTTRLTFNGTQNDLTIDANGTTSLTLDKRANVGVFFKHLSDTTTTNITNGMLTLNGADKGIADIAGKVTVSKYGVLTTNKEVASNEKSGALFYIDRPVTLAAGTEITIGGEEKAAEAPKQAKLLAAPAVASPTADASTADAAKVSVDKGGKVVIDAAKLGENTTALADTDLTVNDEGELQIKNVTSLGTIKVAKSLTGDVTTDSRFIDATVKEGNVVFAAKEDVTGDEVLDARMKERLEAGLSNKETEILGTLNGDAFADKDKLSIALEQAAGGNATAGVLNVAYDANAQVTDAIVRHQLSEHNGKGLWADVFYAKNEAKEIYGNSGYSADIYGGVIGLDGTFSCGATGGVALTIGTADADSKDGVFSTSLDSDFWGVSAYAVKPMGGFNVKADIGYLHFDNDFTGVGDASDASSVTVGLRADYTAFQKGVFSITPHAGIRYTHIDTDAVAFNDDQKMNIVETPVGVTFAGNFETTGWTIVPSYDFTIVPQLADKEVEAFGSADDMKILNGGLYNNVLGVQAQKGNVSFGLHAAYGFGSNDRSNTQVNANVRYTF